MNAELDRLESIFAAAVRQPSPNARAAYLRDACASDSALLQRLEGLLQAHDAAGNFLPSGAAAHVAEGVGSDIGPYKLLQEIGEGGMGTVFLAEQTEPVRRKVALKIIKPGMDSAQVVVRFEAERQALALMDHPNIARVLDVGTTQPDTSGSGRPYFVMELVKGMSITSYCDENRLTPRQRLELFIPVCQAIQHAHQKGIIHRDIKPSNVLVALYDGKPVPKVIDFGVAKAIEQRLTEKTLFTRHGQIVGTFEYMSPEQATLDSLDVDTRSDIYALGVLLYELLTGKTPLDKERLRQAAFGEILRMIREEEPPRPSNRLSASGDELAQLAVHRQSNSVALPQLVRGELDWIVMRCLEKDRSRRYETANGLARDVERYLKDEPVEACPPTAGYRLRKFVRKHKRLLATAAAFVAVLLLGAAASGWQAVRATQAEADANVNSAKAQEKEREAAQQRKEAQKERDEAQKQRDDVKALNDKLKEAQEQLRRTLYAAHLNLAQRAWDSADVDGARDLLERHHPKKGEIDLRGFEWNYLQRLCSTHQVLSVVGQRIGFGNTTFSSDGKRLFTLGRGGTSGKGGGEPKFHEPKLTTFDAQTGKELLTITLKGGGQGQAGVLSPDGKRVAIATRTDNTLRVWDVETGNELFSIKGAGGGIAFSPDGKRLAIHSGKEVKVRDAQTGQELANLKGHTEGLITSALSRDGKRLVSVGTTWDEKEKKYVGSEIKVWDVQAAKELFTVKESSDAAWSASFSSDGKRLLTHAKDAKVWDAETGKELFTLKAQGGGFRSVAFTPDAGRIVTADDVAKWPRIMVWDAQTGQMLFILQGHVSPIYMSAFSPDGKRLASREVERKVLVWDLQTGKEVASLRGVPTPSVFSSLAFSPDGMRLAIDHGPMLGTLKIWNWDVQKDLDKVTLKGISIAGPYGLGAPYFAFSPDLKRVAGISDDTVKVWDARTGQEIISCKGLTNRIQCVAFSADGKRLAAGDGVSGRLSSKRPAVPGVVMVWDAQTGKELNTLKGHTHAITCAVFSPDGKRLASVSADLTVKVWDAQTGREIHSVAPDKQNISPSASVVYSADGKRLAAAGKLWDAETGKPLRSLKGAFLGSAFSPDGKRLAGAGNVWDTQSGAGLYSFKGLGSFSPDGKRLASASGDQVKVYDAQTGQELFSLKVPGGSSINVVAFSADGQQLGRVDLDGTVTIWDATPLPEKR
jgi:WD40 repeat protein/serine/threonine protein kinase